MAQDTVFYQKIERIFDQKSGALVMGILNVTVDSFYDGGQYGTVDSALFQVEKMLNDKVEGTNNKMNNIMVPIQQMMYTVRDTFYRTQSILTSGLYTSLGNSYILESMVQESVKFISNIF